LTFKDDVYRFLLYSSIELRTLFKENFHYIKQYVSPEIAARERLRITCDYWFKVILIGDKSVGKTSIIGRAIYDEYDDYRPHSIGTECYNFGIRVGDKVTKLEIFDPSGNTTFTSSIRLSFYNTHGVFLTYDVTRRETLYILPNLIKIIRENADSNIRLYLLGNKIDMDKSRQVSKQEA